MKDINHVVITGRIVNLYVINHYPARVIVTIYADGNNPKIFAANKTADYIIKNLKVGDYVTAECNLQSSTKNKIGKTVTVFVDTIKKHCSRVASENNFFLAGDIVSVRTNTKLNISTMIIATTVNGRRSTVEVTFYDPDHRIFGIISDNPDISIGGRIQTVSYTVNNKKVYRQIYVADFPRNNCNE